MGHFLDVCCGMAQSMVGGATCGYEALGCIRKQTEQVRSKSVSSVPP